MQYSCADYDHSPGTLYTFSPFYQFSQKFYYDPSRHTSSNAGFQASLQGNGNGGVPSTSPFDPFVTASNPLSAASAVGPVQANPFAHDTATALGGATFFTGQSGFQQPVSLDAEYDMELTYPTTSYAGPIPFICSDRTSQPKHSRLPAKCS
jgi:hypothetical protein